MQINILHSTIDNVTNATLGVPTLWSLRVWLGSSYFITIWWQVQRIENIGNFLVSWNLSFSTFKYQQYSLQRPGNPLLCPSNVTFFPTSFTWPQHILSYQDIFKWSNVSLSVISCLEISFDFGGNYILLFVAPILLIVFALIFYLCGYFFQLAPCSRKNPIEARKMWKLGCIRALLTTLNLVYFPLSIALMQVCFVFLKYLTKKHKGFQLFSITRWWKLFGILSLDSMQWRRI